jgi:transcriptional regulator with XRE-family HTH domain
LINRHLYDRNLTQAWLAQQVGYTNSSLSRIMRGHHKPNADLALAISEALGLSEEERQELLVTVPSRRSPQRGVHLGRVPQSCPRQSVSNGHNLARKDNYLTLSFVN